MRSSIYSLYTQGSVILCYGVRTKRYYITNRAIFLCLDNLERTQLRTSTGARESLGAYLIPSSGHSYSKSASYPLTGMITRTPTDRTSELFTP